MHERFAKVRRHDERVQLGGRHKPDPVQTEVVPLPQTSAQEGAPEADVHDMAMAVRGEAVVHQRDIAHRDVQSGFLQHFPSECVRQGLAVVHAAARKKPVPPPGLFVLDQEKGVFVGQERGHPNPGSQTVSIRFGDTM